MATSFFPHSNASSFSLPFHHMTRFVPEDDEEEPDDCETLIPGLFRRPDDPESDAEDDEEEVEEGPECLPRVVEGSRQAPGSIARANEVNGESTQPSDRITLKPRRRTQSLSPGPNDSLPTRTQGTMGHNLIAATALDQLDKDADDGLLPLPKETQISDIPESKARSVKRPLEQPTCLEIQYKNIDYQKVQYSPIPRKKIAYHQVLLHDIRFSKVTYNEFPVQKKTIGPKKLGRSKSFAMSDLREKPGLGQWADKIEDATGVLL